MRYDRTCSASAKGWFHCPNFCWPFLSQAGCKQTGALWFPGFPVQIFPVFFWFRIPLCSDVQHQKKPATTAINPKNEKKISWKFQTGPAVLPFSGHSAIRPCSAMGQAQIKSALHIDRSLVISWSFWWAGKIDGGKNMWKNHLSFLDALMLLDVSSCTFQFESVEWFESFHFGRVSAWRMHFRMVSSMNYRHAGWSWVWHMALRGGFRIQRAISKACHFCVEIFYSGLNLRKTMENPQLCYAKSERKVPSQATAILFKCAQTFSLEFLHPQDAFSLHIHGTPAFQERHLKRTEWTGELVATCRMFHRMFPKKKPGENGRFHQSTII